jgi:hypothetical protein
VHFCIFFGWAFFAGIRGSGFLIGVAVFPAFLLSGLTALFGGSELPFSIDSWLNTTPAYYIESLAIFYVAGWAVSALTMTSVMPDDTPAAGRAPKADNNRLLLIHTSKVSSFLSRAGLIAFAVGSVHRSKPSTSLCLLRRR